MVTNPNIEQCNVFVMDSFLIDNNNTKEICVVEDDLILGRLKSTREGLGVLDSRMDVLFYLPPLFLEAGAYLLFEQSKIQGNGAGKLILKMADYLSSQKICNNIIELREKIQDFYKQDVTKLSLHIKLSDDNTILDNLVKFKTCEFRKSVSHNSEYYCTKKYLGFFHKTMRYDAYYGIEMTHIRDSLMYVNTGEVENFKNRLFIGVGLDPFQIANTPLTTKKYFNKIFTTFIEIAKLGENTGFAFRKVWLLNRTFKDLERVLNSCSQYSVEYIDNCVKATYAVLMLLKKECNLENSITDPSKVVEQNSLLLDDFELDDPVTDLKVILEYVLKCVEATSIYAPRLLKFTVEENKLVEQVK